VAVITWNNVGDQLPIPSYADTSQSGVFFVDGRPKPALQAFRFPLVAWHAGGSRVTVWGRAPAGGRLEIQRRIGSTWSTVRTLDVTGHSTFLTNIAHRGGVSLRARVGGQTSLTWRVG
jgi:hypothetical protein